MNRHLVRHRRYADLGWLALWILLGNVTFVSAWDLHNQPFGFRLLTTNDRNTGFSPAAHPLFSVNPAADDFMREAPFTFNAIPAFIWEYTGLGAGGFVSSTSLGASFRPTDEGTMMASYGRTDVFDSTTRQGFDFGLNSDNFTLRYSRHVRANVTLGGSVKLSRSWSQLKDRTSKIESNGFISEFNLGFLVGLNESWTAGMLMTQSPLWSKAKIIDAGSQSSESNYALVSRYRPGIGWRPTPSLGLYLDADYIRVTAKDAKMNFARGNLLAEYYPIPVLALRAGAIVDSAAKVTYNAGFGYYGFSAVKFDFGYTYNAFTEVRREFGKIHYMYVILSTAF